MINNFFQLKDDFSINYQKNKFYQNKLINLFTFEDIKIILN